MFPSERPHHFWCGLYRLCDVVATASASLTGDVLDVAAAQSDIVKFAVRQFGQRIACYARVVPGGKFADQCCGEYVQATPM